MVFLCNILWKRRKYMHKKIFAFVLAAALLCTAAFSAAAAAFTDVADDAYYADAAERMAARGILSGYGDGGYHGDESVTRAHIAALACKMLGKVDEATALAGVTAFSDIASDSWATGYVNYAHANGIILGDGDGKFRPDDLVKYEEVIKVIVCALELDEDVKIDPTDWSKEYIEAAEDAGLLDDLIGKKGEYMLRSDIAVICDAAMTLLDEEAAEETTTATTKKSVSGSVSARPVTTAKTEKTEPEETTAATTAESKPAETTTVTAATTAEPKPAETTAATTKAPSSTTKENMLPFVPFS